MHFSETSVFAPVALQLEGVYRGGVDCTVVGVTNWHCNELNRWLLHHVLHWLSIWVHVLTWLGVHWLTVHLWLLHTWLIQWLLIIHWLLHSRLVRLLILNWLLHAWLHKWLLIDRNTGCKLFVLFTFIHLFVFINYIIF